MRVSLSDWRGFGFVELSAEAMPAASAEAEARALFTRFERTLGHWGLSFGQALRSRLFGRDRAARDAASEVRREALSGPARCATSSYIAPRRFSSPASVAMDLIAVKPAPGAEKRIRENEPPRLPCRYLTWGPLVVLSGQTAVLPTLEEQASGDILPRITEYLAEAGAGWDSVQRVSCYLHESQDPDEMRRLFLKEAKALPPLFEICPVAGYSAEGKLVEVEVTALARS